MSHVKWGERTYGADKMQVFQWGEGPNVTLVNSVLFLMV
jgi:hypothetical protein